MADIFSEVDEEVRREQAEALWARYGNYVVAGVLMVILGIAAYWGWQKFEAHRAVKAAEAYVEAIRADAERSDALLSRISGEGGGFAALARLRLAADAVSAGASEKAKGILVEISGDPAVDPALRGLAALKAALLELEAGRNAEAKALVVELDREGNPYRYSAMEIAGLAELQAGEKEKARAIFAKLRDLAAVQPAMPMMEARAAQMLDRLAE